MNFRPVASSACLMAVLIPAAALAGGYAAPIDTAPLVRPTSQPESARYWAGSYGGASLGYSFAGDDEVGLAVYDDETLLGRRNGLSDVELSGATVGLHLGYRWHRLNWVYGPELAIEGGAVDDRGEFGLDGDTASVESAINYVVSIAFKAGYLMAPDTLIYGSLGAAHGDFDYILSSGGDSATRGYDRLGYVMGLGVEHRLGARTSIFGEYQYRQFGSEDVRFMGGDSDLSVVTVTTPSHQNIRLGVNFSF